MNWLRRRRDTIEQAWASDRFTAKDKAHAFFVLGQNVILVRHPFDREPRSGAGNCWCGRDQRSSIHDVVLDPKVKP